MMKRYAPLILPVFLSILLTSGPLSAREATELESMTVTANKTEENIQDVPASLTVMNSQTLKDARIQDVLDIANLVPGLLITKNGVSGMNTPSMRGITAGVESFSVASAMYVDGVPYLSGAGFETILEDVERVEVLRGPQGTLYGSGTEAGVINVVTRQPDNAFRGRASAETGSDNKHRLTFSASGPVVSDTLYLGLSAVMDQKDGQIQNTYSDKPEDNQRKWFGRAHMRWTPSDALDISYIASQLEYDDDGPQMTLSAQGAKGFGLTSYTPREVSSDLPSWNRATNNSHAFKVDWKLTEDLTFSSVTTHSVYDDNAYTDWDFTNQPYYHVLKENEYTTSSQEFRLHGDGDKVDWLMGFYGDLTDNDIYYTEYMMGMAPKLTSSLQEGASQALFGQMTVSLTDPLSVIAGLRYDRSEKEFTNRITDKDLDNSWNEISPKVGLTWSFSDHNLAYGTVSKGFRTGGFNALVRTDEHTSFDAETLWSYELGTNNTFMDGMLTVNAAIYYMTIDDIQVTEYVSANEGYVTNGAKGTGKGAELEINACPVKGLNIIAGLSISDVEFDDYTVLQGDYSGNKAPYAPKYNANFGVQYRDASGFYVRGDVIGYGKMYLDSTNTYEQKAYSLVNAKIGYETERMDIYLYSKNLLDENYDNDQFYGGNYTIYGDPREVGVSVACRF